MCGQAPYGLSARAEGCPDRRHVGSSRTEPGDQPRMIARAADPKGRVTNGRPGPRADLLIREGTHNERYCSSIRNLAGRRLTLFRPLLALVEFY